MATGGREGDWTVGREGGQAAGAGRGDQAVDGVAGQAAGGGGWAGQSAEADAGAAADEGGQDGEDDGEERKRYKCSYCGQVKRGHSCVLGRRNRDDFFFPNAAPAPNFPGMAGPPAGAVMQRITLIRGLRSRIARRLAEMEGQVQLQRFDPAAWSAAQQMAAFQGNRLEMVQPAQGQGGPMVHPGNFYAHAAMGMHPMPAASDRGVSWFTQQQ